VLQNLIYLAVAYSIFNCKILLAN